MRRARLWLCVPPLVFCLLDQSVTLYCQPARYWAGDRSTAQEGNPWFHWLLMQHPLAFEAGIAAWIAVFALVILFTPRRVAMTISIAIVLGHTWGTSTWLLFTVPYGYWLALLLFLASAIIIVATWERASSAAPQVAAAQHV
jgi:hypothetical protein